MSFNTAIKSDEHGNIKEELFGLGENSADAVVGIDLQLVESMVDAAPKVANAAVPLFSDQLYRGPDYQSTIIETPLVDPFFDSLNLTGDFDYPPPPGPLDIRPRPSTLPHASVIPTRAVTLDPSCQAPALPAYPFVVEPTHFFCGSRLEQIVSALVVGLTKHDVVFQFKESSCKFRCKFLFNYEIVRFIARVFLVNGIHLVEFQRRSGPNAGFSSMFDEVGGGLDIDRAVNASAQSFHQRLPRPGRAIFSPLPVPGVSKHVGCRASDLETYIRRLGSKYGDEQASALRSLANLSEAAENIPGILAAGVPAAVWYCSIPMFLRLLRPGVLLPLLPTWRAILVLRARLWRWWDNWRSV